MADLVSPLNGDRDDDYHASVQYLCLQGQYQLILPPNGMQDELILALQAKILYALQKEVGASK